MHINTQKNRETVEYNTREYKYNNEKERNLQIYTAGEKLHLDIRKTGEKNMMKILSMSSLSSEKPG